MEIVPHNDGFNPNFNGYWDFVRNAFFNGFAHPFIRRQVGQLAMDAAAHGVQRLSDRVFSPGTTTTSTTPAHEAGWHGVKPSSGSGAPKVLRNSVLPLKPPTLKRSASQGGGSAPKRIRGEPVSHFILQNATRY